MTAASIRIYPEIDASLDIDVQTAFMESHEWDGRPVKGGGLPVPEGHLILPAVLATTAKFPHERRYATLDQHPAGHISWVTSYDGFLPYQDLTLDEVRTWNDRNGRIVSPRFSLDELRAYLALVPGHVQTLWPPHGDMRTAEAELHPAVAGLGYRLVLIKGTDPRCDSYSGVRDNAGRPTGLADELRRDGVRRVFCKGLAYTHCVGWTALDLAAEGFEVFVLKDATRPVPIPGLSEAMDAQLAAAGVHVIDSSALSE